MQKCFICSKNYIENRSRTQISWGYCSEECFEQGNSLIDPNTLNEISQTRSGRELINEARRKILVNIRKEQEAMRFEVAELNFYDMKSAEFFETEDKKEWLQSPIGSEMSQGEWLQRMNAQTIPQLVHFTEKLFQKIDEEYRLIFLLLQDALPNKEEGRIRELTKMKMLSDRKDEIENYEEGLQKLLKEYKEKQLKMSLKMKRLTPNQAFLKGVELLEQHKVESRDYEKTACFMKDIITQMKKEVIFIHQKI